jgi:Tfp pilus assembly protein PilF
LAGYAGFLWRRKKEIGPAMDYYKRAADRLPNSPDPNANYAQLLLGSGDREQGFLYLDRALDALRYGSESVHVETMVYLYAHDDVRRDFALARLKTELLAGHRSSNWDYSITLERAAQDGHPKLDLLKALTLAANGKIPLSDLDQYAEWREAR